MTRSASFTRIALAWTFASMLVAPAALSAQQEQNEHATNPLAAGSRIGFAFSGLYAAPQDEFRQFVNDGWGLGGSFLVKVDPAGVLALRVDANWITYGNSRTNVPLSPTTGDLIRVELDTWHNVFMGGVGLQLQAPSGFVRPYVGATAGMGAFWTQTSIEGSDNDDQPFASTTNQRDNTFAWSGVGGLVLPLTTAGTVLVDLGVTYQGNGQATYLPPGVRFNDAGEPVMRRPVHGNTNMVLYRVGVRIGF